MSTGAKMTASAPHPEQPDDLLKYRLSLRLGPTHARQRLSIERNTEANVFGRDKKSFHIENLASAPGFIRTCLKLAGLFQRGQENARRPDLIHNEFQIASLPQSFYGYRILHLTDLHVDMDNANLQAVIAKIKPLEYDLCVMTGDYRSLTWGPIDGAMAGLGQLRQAIKGETYAVLGNHDSVRMVPGLEDMGFNLLMNEHVTLQRGDHTIYLAGVDDAHFYKVHNLHQARDGIPAGSLSLLLSHTPEIWREASYAGFDVFLCGHTHGGQICLPGGIPITLEGDCPRALGRGPWQVNGMQGYTSAGSGTSVVNVRLNCPPEVTLHTLTRGPT
jgi:predicted MPP superfamily phosphohydrolase